MEFFDKKDFSYMGMFSELVGFDRAGNTEQIRKYIVSKAKAFGYTPIIDNAGNIICSCDGVMKLAIQTHYDIFCPTIYKKPPTIVEKDGDIYADGRYLGADLMSVASLLFIMQSNAVFQAIFTADKYNKMKGVNKVVLDKNVKYFINIGYHRDESLIVGSLGSAVVYADIPLDREFRDKIPLYQVSGNEEFRGGDSGYAVTKTTDNPIYMSFDAMKNESDVYLVDISTPSTISFIPCQFKMIYSAKNKALFPSEFFEHKTLSSKSGHIIKNTQYISKFILSIKDRIEHYNTITSQPESSKALVQSKIINNILVISVNVRYSNDKQQSNIVSDISRQASSCGFNTELEYISTPWIANPNSRLVDIALKEIKTIYSDSECKNSQGDIECSIIKQLYPDLEICSFGPKIENHHKETEKMKSENVNNFMKILISTIKKVSM